MPSNITLKVWDAYSELPEEYAGAFDIVHLRTLYSTVIDNKVEPLLSNCLKMLKPGGYLQWDESDASTLACYTPNSSIKSDATRSLVKIQDATARMYSKMTPDWLHSLPATLEERGCKIVAKEDFEPEARLARAWTDNMLLVWRGVIPLIPEGVKMPMPPGEDLPKTLSRKGYSELFREAVKETGQGVRLGMKYHVTVAKKT